MTDERRALARKLRCATDAQVAEELLAEALDSIDAALKVAETPHKAGPFDGSDGCTACAMRRELTR